MPITLADWREALAAAEVPVEGFTVREAMTSTGKGERWVRNRLREMMAAGQVVHVGWRAVPRLDGQNAKVPVYRLKSKK